MNSKSGNQEPQTAGSASQSSGAHSHRIRRAFLRRVLSGIPLVGLPLLIEQRASAHELELPQSAPVNADAFIAGGSGVNGTVSVRGTDGLPLIELLGHSNEAVIGAGQQSRPGRLSMYNGSGQNTVNLTTADATLRLGGSGANGTVSVQGTDGQPLVELLGHSNEAVIGAGRQNRPGRLSMYNGSGQNTVNLTTADATLRLGGSGANGTVSVQGTDGLPLVELLGRSNEAVIGLGQINRPGRISVYNGAGSEAVRLDGSTGDIWIANADCAEEFDIGVAEVEPGTVMVLTDDGKLVPSLYPYDTRVAGIISGAGSYKPGLVLDRKATGRKRVPVALMGKVFCCADATQTPIRVGDLLTTAEREGHAMRAIDPHRAFGAVIGKALAPLASGYGLIPVLVALQ